ncbi:MAG: TrkA family potassium uptake protein [Ignavibacteriae bacterium]|nr:TrkA family potassium uptake protein [Ignavibacteriota bacterium]MCB9214636.1 TrkA family potassium uptake protein [Ignavibacteria bacterium]
MPEKKRFVVIGLGNFGANAAAMLYRQGHEVIAVDISEETVDRVAPNVTRAAVGDGRDGTILSHLGGDEADVGIVSTGDDITASVLATLTLLDLNIKEVIVKVISEDHSRVMEKIGASQTVFPEKDSAENLAQSLSDDSVLSYTRIGAGFAMQEMKTPQCWQGKTLRDLRLPSKHNLSVAGIHHMKTDTLSIPPDPDIPLANTDTLLIAGSDTALQRARDLEERA